jgi:hypothetical protein
VGKDSVGAKKASEARICRNMSLTLGHHKALRVGRSKVHGWGVFCDEAIERGELISEYVGEIISQDEADRRGNLYDKKNCSYLFNLNDELVAGGLVFSCVSSWLLLLFRVFCLKSLSLAPCPLPLPLALALDLALDLALVSILLHTHTHLPLPLLPKPFKMQPGKAVRYGSPTIPTRPMPWDASSSSTVLTASGFLQRRFEV